MTDIESCDPDEAPDPAAWLSFGEGERMDPISDAHRRLRVRIPRMMGHVAIHCIIETQIAIGSPPETTRALERLLAKARSRHDALHEIGAVLSTHMLAMMQEGKEHVQEDLDRELEKLGR